MTARRVLPNSRPHDLADGRLYYLATPYSKYPDGIEAAYIVAARIAGGLLKCGVAVYSPIAHTHPIAIHSGIDPYDHSIWLPFDEHMMRVCDGLIVCKIAGWETSKGVAHEIGFFERSGKPVVALAPLDLLEGEQLV